MEGVWHPSSQASFNCTIQADNECIKKIDQDSAKCQLPCEGVYADIKQSDVEILDETEFEVLQELSHVHSWSHYFPFNLWLDLRVISPPKTTIKS